MSETMAPGPAQMAGEKIMKPLNSEEKPLKSLPFIGAAVILGVLSGFLIFSQTSGKSLATVAGNVAGNVATSETKTVGSKDTKTFRDCTSGQLEVNDDKVTDEGTHMLVRPGGVSQTVYLTSSVLDLNQFTGKQAEVCGETYKGQKAGWLMDVGRVTLK
ncbi:MAG: hypothetical protein M1120_01855 [Patescibacteria group bacterium]|nr:hypothetical protein [Patescibacteria group bacterium]